MVDQKRLHERLTYDPNTGIFRFKGVKRGAGCLATYANKSYRVLRVDGVLYKAHRLAWLYMTGDWPKYEIDHINGDSSDNRFANLRDVPRKVNARNVRLSVVNSSGITGVHFDKNRDKWMAYIRVNSLRKHLGRYFDFFEACCARKSAERMYGFHLNHGKKHGA